MSSTRPRTLHHLALAALIGLGAPLGALAANLDAVAAQAGAGTSNSAFDAVVEAVRQTVVAAQVAVQLDQHPPRHRRANYSAAADAPYRRPAPILARRSSDFRRLDWPRRLAAHLPTHAHH